MTPCLSGTATSPFSCHRLLQHASEAPDAVQDATVSCDSLQTCQGCGHFLIGGLDEGRHATLDDGQCGTSRSLPGSMPACVQFHAAHIYDVTWAKSFDVYSIPETGCKRVNLHC